MLRQRLIRQLLEGSRLAGERGVPEALDRHLFEDGSSQGVLVLGRKLGGRVKGLLEHLRHETNLRKDPRPEPVTLPNESRLSCGALVKKSFLNLRAPSASGAG